MRVKSDRESITKKEKSESYKYTVVSAAEKKYRTEQRDSNGVNDAGRGQKERGAWTEKSRRRGSPV